MDLRGVILAGGTGSRLSPATTRNIMMLCIQIGKYCPVMF